jgi:hypothetical protein
MTAVTLWRGAKYGASEREIADQFDLTGPDLRIASFEILQNDFEVLFHFEGGALNRVSLVLASSPSSDQLDRLADDLHSLLSEKYGKSRKRKSDPDIGEWLWEKGQVKVTLTLIEQEELAMLTVDYESNHLSELDKL